MNVWIISVGEPLPCDGANVRLRRMGNLAQYISDDENNRVEWFSVSFDHYKKIQRVEDDTDIALRDNYILHLLRVNGYKKNISVSRIIHHLMGAKKIYKKMCSIDTKPDVIIASMEPLENSSVSVKYAKENNIPIVVDVRDLWPEIYYEVIPEKLHFLLDIYVKHCAKSLSKTMSGTTAILGLSDDFLEYGLKYSQREKRYLDRVIPIGYPNYDYNKYKGNFKLLKERFDIDENDFIISFLGNFGNQFEFSPIVEAAKALKDNTDIKFVLCGTGIQLETLKEETKNCNVIYPGWIEKEDISTLTANSHLGLAPYIDSQNYTKNTPNKFGEYLSASLPPVLGVGGLMERIVTERKCGCRYHSGQELSEIILDFYNDRDKLQTFSENARMLYEEMFNADKINERFVKYLNELSEKGENQNVAL